MRLESPDEPSSSRSKCESRISILSEYMIEGGIGAEIGVFKGAFINWMLLSRPSKLYIVDPWFRFSKDWHWAKGNPSTIDAFMKILNEYRNEIESKLIEPRIEYSHEFFELIPDCHLDWVYIDSTHGYAQTKMEIQYALKKVKPGGYIMGDDYTSDEKHPHHGVYRAVKEYEALNKIHLLVDGIERQFVAQKTALNNSAA